MKGQKIVITGGAGFIGSSLVERLAQENSVRVIDTLYHGNPFPEMGIKDKVELVEQDIRERDKMIELCKGADYVFHLAVQCVRVSLSEPELVHEVNATGSLNMNIAALKAGVKKFIYVSSSEVYGTAIKHPMNEDHALDPLTVYGGSKLAGELYTRAFHRTHGLPAVVVRPFNTYGPREHFEGPYGEVIPRFAIRLLQGKAPLIFGDGTQTRDFTHVSDTVEGICLAAESEELIGDVVNIARGEEVSISEIANILSKELGREDLGPIYLAPRPADVMRHYAGIEKARKILEFSPQIDIHKGIPMYLSWLNGYLSNKDISTLLPERDNRNWGEVKK